MVPEAVAEHGAAGADEAGAQVRDGGPRPRAGLRKMVAPLELRKEMSVSFFSFKLRRSGSEHLSLLDSQISAIRGASGAEMLECWECRL